MTTLIDAVQTQEPGSELVELFEVEIDSGYIYLHSGVDTDLSTVQFRDLTTPTTIRTYTAIPIELKGIERNADGASPRPSLTIANILSTFSGLLGDLTNKDLVGKRVIRRTTLKKYLVGESPDVSNPPIEFPVEKFIIDRIAGENKVAINFELAAVMDLEGVKLPNRIVVGKYCGWEYQGVSRGRGGCTWAANSNIKIGTTEYKAYFTIDDEPIVPGATSFTAWSSSTAAVDDLFSYLGKKWRANAATTAAPTVDNVDWQRMRTYIAYAAGTGYVYDSDDYEYVEHSNTIWRLIKSGTGQTPAAGSLYWTRGDICGKILGSCKARYQWEPKSGATTIPTFNKDTSRVMPFGGFPGSEKYR